MRSNSFLLIAGLIFVLITDAILWFQLKRILNKAWQSWSFGLHSLFFASAWIVFQLRVPHLKGPEGYYWSGILIGLLFLCYAPKVIYILFNGIGLLLKKCCKKLSRWVRTFAAVLSGFLFLVLLYSITWGRYHYKIETINVAMEHLPPAFDRLKIVQLSDIHLGSYGKHYKGIRKLVEEVNRLQPDLIVFTGDMVNNFASEMQPWISTLQELEAPCGKYAITGNHDYGDYTRWPDNASKRHNLSEYFENMARMGFHMLNNARIPIVCNGDTIWLAGVENWGKPPFPQYGKLSHALDSLSEEDFVILLSHDPSHWQAEVLQYPQVYLTLSGHTHAMQFGIKIGGKEWSPARYIYPEYDGLYRRQDQYLYVSRGQGYLGFPGRVGLRPVITSLILHPAEKQQVKDD